MKKFTLFIASLFFTFGAMAQTYQYTQGDLLTSDELNAIEEETYFAFRNPTGTNNGYFAQSAETEGTYHNLYRRDNLSEEVVYIWEPAGEGKFYIKNLDGKYMQTSSCANWGDKSTAALFYTTNPQNKNGESVAKNYLTQDNNINEGGFDDPNKVRFVASNADGGEKWINCAGTTNRKAPFYNNGPGGWTIFFAYEVTREEVYNMSIDEYQYMTLYLDRAVTIPEGVVAYAVTGVNTDNELQMEAIADVIPAEEAVIIYAENAGDYAFVYTSEEGTKAATNLMKGTLTDSYVAPAAGYDAYVMTLDKENDRIVMGKAQLNADGGTFRNRANKAYLEIAQEVAAGAPMFSLERGEGTTGIEHSELKIENSTVIYDLAGRRVEKMEKGIYIVNGKKVIR